MGIRIEWMLQSINLEARIASCVAPILANPSTVDPGVHALILMLQRIHNEMKFIVTRMEKVKGKGKCNETNNCHYFRPMLTKMLLQIGNSLLWLLIVFV